MQISKKNERKRDFPGNQSTPSPSFSPLNLILLFSLPPSPHLMKPWIEPYINTLLIAPLLVKAGYKIYIYLGGWHMGSSVNVRGTLLGFYAIWHQPFRSDVYCSWRTQSWISCCSPFLYHIRVCLCSHNYHYAYSFFFFFLGWGEGGGHVAWWGYPSFPPCMKHYSSLEIDKLLCTQIWDELSFHILLSEYITQWTLPHQRIQDAILI